MVMSKNDWWNKEKCKKHLTELEQTRLKDL